jgi:hypothetical protein
VPSPWIGNAHANAGSASSVGSALGAALSDGISTGVPLVVVVGEATDDALAEALGALALGEGDALALVPGPPEQAARTTRMVKRPAR